MTFQEFVGLMLSPAGIGAAVGVAVYFLVEYTRIEKELAPRYKRLVAMALSFAFPAFFSIVRLAFGFVESPATWQAFFTEILWPALQAGAIAFLESHAIHMRKLSPDRKGSMGLEPDDILRV